MTVTTRAECVVCRKIKEVEAFTGMCFRCAKKMVKAMREAMDLGNEDFTLNFRKRR